MKEKSIRKSEYLFRELGAIDDYLLQESMLYRPARRRSPGMILIAACLCLSILLVFGAILISNRESKNNAPNNSDPFQSSNLDAILLECRDSGIEHTTVASENELDLFGPPCVVWQYADSQELCVSRPLTQSEVTSLTRSMEKGSTVGSDSPALSCRVWIVPGDGTVLSPYLKSSSGNIGIDLFEYEAELIPADEFTSRLSKILYES